jgi:putative nucleotidyltransferase with HDIG domain
MSAVFDSSKLSEDFDRGEEVFISFQYYSKGVENDINSILSKILSRCDKLYLYEALEPVVRELVQNAAKANMKRLYFESMNLDIADEADYEKGMREFKKVAYHPELLKDKLLNSTYRIVLKIRKTDAGMDIDIINNARIRPRELVRLEYRIEKAGQCRNFTEAYENVFDTTEGAGLGIILSAMLLKNAGMDVSIITFAPEGDSMRVSLAVPFEQRSFEITSAIRDSIIEDVESLPTFPEDVIEIREMCRDQDMTIETISDRICRDPSLTADVLRLSNSAGFITGKRIKTVTEAIMVIGLGNLEMVLTAASARMILDKRYRKYGQVWEHCDRTAFYARMIALDMGFSGISEQAMIAGLLHDIGKFVLLATGSGVVSRISDIVKNRRIRSTAIIEEISIGISHAAIGALMAERWNFPDELIETIRYHHAPLDPSIVHRDLVAIVHMANQLAEERIQGADSRFIESGVLEKFSLDGPSAFERYHRRLSARYASHHSLARRGAR